MATALFTIGPDNYLEMEEKTKQLTIESLIEQINNRFEDIAEIFVAHLPIASKVSQLHITVHTGEAESLEQYIEITPADEVAIDIGETEPLSIPFQVMATFDGPGHIHGSEGTTIYMSNDVIGAEPRELDTGLSILQKKLARICPSCEEEIEKLGKHYAENFACQEAERV